MVEPTPEFGAQLRREREAAGLTLEELAAKIYFTRSYLSRVERGERPATATLAQLYDAALGTGGRLDAILHGLSIVGAPLSDEEIDQLRALFAGPTRAGRPRLPLRGPIPFHVFITMFENARLEGQLKPAADVGPSVLASTRLLTQLAEAGGPEAGALWVMAARFAEYLGWLTQELGHDDWARRLTRHAVALAARGEVDLTAMALLREGDIALYQGNHHRTVGVAREALTLATEPRLRGLATQRLAQGYALARDEDMCLQALADSRDLFAVAAADPRFPAVGSTMIVDQTQMALGWCLLDLGKPDEAVGILRNEIDKMPQEAARARTRYEARLGRSLAAAGELAPAVELAREVADATQFLDSATAAADLRAIKAYFPDGRSAAARQLSRLLAQLGPAT